MSEPDIVSADQWLEARQRLLVAEKELTDRRDAVARLRRELPMTRVEKEYTFRGPQGPATLVDLFDGCGQLLVYHFMLDPEWDAGCPACSLVVDNIGHLSHLRARDTSLVLVSRAPLERIEAYRERMGWTVPWFSSHGSDFNYDFHVSIDVSRFPVQYNYKHQAQLEAEDVNWREWSGEQPGASAFLRTGTEVFHTYSTFARGLDLQVGTYNWLDLTARGRQEAWEEPAGRANAPMMGWLHRHDEYPH